MVLMSVVMTSVWSQSLVNFGFKGGIEVINMSFNADALKASNRAGFFVGPSLRFNLPIVGLGLDVNSDVVRSAAAGSGGDLNEWLRTQGQRLEDDSPESRWP